MVTASALAKSAGESSLATKEISARDLASEFPASMDPRADLVSVQMAGFLLAGGSALPMERVSVSLAAVQTPTLTARASGSGQE